MNEQTIVLKEQRDIVRARQAGRKVAKELGFGTADQTRLATAISEIARNALQYAGGGVCEIQGMSERFEKTVHIRVADEGPGISDIEKAMTDGYTTSKGLGAGLPGSKRLMHDFHIESQTGGTIVTMRMIRKLL